MNITETVSAARGHWPQLLPALGIHVRINHHTACPMCGGKDRFRFDNKEERGTWFCNQCGAGDGLALVQKTFSIEVTDAAARVADAIGHNDAGSLLAKTVKTGSEAEGEAIATAVQVVAKAKIRTKNEYLAGKGWPECQVLTLNQSMRVGGISYHSGDLIVPLKTLDGQLVNIQLINRCGDKRTLKGGKVTGASYCFETATPPRRIWLAEGYATGLTVHELMKERVFVALSANNLLSLASLVRSQYPDTELIIAADRDINGVGQQKAEKAANIHHGHVALPPVFGDWNDAYLALGTDDTLKALINAAKPKPESPFLQLSEAEFKEMGGSDKAELVIQHYQESLAVDTNGEVILRYEDGAWKAYKPTQLNRELADLYLQIRAKFTAAGIASVIDTMKLILPLESIAVRQLIGFRNGVLNTLTGQFSPHSKDNWLRTVNNVNFTPPIAGETLENSAPAFWQWLDRASGHQHQKRDCILAGLFMVMANRYDWQMFLEVTGPGGSGKSIMADIATMLAGKDNTTSATIETLETSRERASIIGYSLIILPDQEKWSGDGAGIKAITGGDAVSVDPKYKSPYATQIPAVILAVNNNPMRFTDRSGGVSRRRVILHFAEVVPANERDPELKEKIAQELAVVVRHLMQRFSNPNDARALLQAHQNSAEALGIKRDSDPLMDFCGYLTAGAEPNGMYMGNATIKPFQPRRYLYHAYMAFMEANGFLKPVSMKSFSLALENLLRDFSKDYLKRKTKLGIQTNLELSEESNGQWLPKCDELKS